MIRRLFCAAALLAHPGLAFAQVSQQIQCFPPDQMVERLLSQHGERPVFLMMNAEQQWVAIFRNEETGTWTEVTEQADGTSCMTAFGDRFQTLPALKGEST